MIKNGRDPKSVGRTLVPLAVSLAILDARLVAVHSGEAAEAPSPVDLQPSSGLVTDVVPSCPDGIQLVINGVVYGAFGDDVAEVLGFEGYPSTDLVIPWDVTSPDGREYKVVRITDDAFRDVAVVESVVIPDTVTEVGRNVLGGCMSLTVLTVPVSGGCHHGDRSQVFEDLLP